MQNGREIRECVCFQESFFLHGISKFYLIVNTSFYMKVRKAVHSIYVKQ